MLVRVGLPCNEQWICSIAGWFLSIIIMLIFASFLYYLLKECYQRYIKTPREKEKKKKKKRPS